MEKALEKVNEFITRVKKECDLPLVEMVISKSSITVKMDFGEDYDLGKWKEEITSISNALKFHNFINAYSINAIGNMLLFYLNF